MNRLTAKNVMTAPVTCVGLEDSIPEVARMMTARHISGLPVLDGSGHLVGIVTEGDILRKAAGAGGRTLLSYVVPGQRREMEEDWRRATGRVAGDVMSPDVVKASLDTPVHELAGIMARNGINRVPICSNGDVVGIVTRNDILRIFHRPDEELRLEAHDTILKDLWVDPDGLEITARDGVIVVKGEVPRHSDVRLIETFAGMIDGVVGIDVSGLTFRHDD